MPTDKELLEATVKAVQAGMKRSKAIEKIERQLAAAERREAAAAAEIMRGETEPEE